MFAGHMRGGPVKAAVVAMLVFAAATQGYFMVRSRLWETAVLLLAAFTLLRPGYWMDQIYPPLQTLPTAELIATAGGNPADGNLRVVFEGVNIDGDLVTVTAELPLGPKASGEERLQAAGLEFREEDGKLLVDNVAWDSYAQSLGIEFDWEVKRLEIPTGQPDKQWMYIPALILVGLVAILQRRRRGATAAA